MRPVELRFTQQYYMDLLAIHLSFSLTFSLASKWKPTHEVALREGGGPWKYIVQRDAQRK